MLWLDFETRSRCDLTKHGVYNYAQDPSTNVLCMSYAFDDDDVVTWLPSQPFPEKVKAYKGQIYAHNAAFERLIFWYVLPAELHLKTVLLHRNTSPRQLCAWQAGRRWPLCWRIHA
jgi:hypothetical protein